MKLTGNNNKVDNTNGLFGFISSDGLSGIDNSCIVCSKFVDLNMSINFSSTVLMLSIAVAL